MKLQQLRYIYEVARRGLNVSEAADALHTSQPGVSKQIRQLEEELGIPLFNRTGKRLTGITEPGRAVLAMAQHILQEVDNIKRVGSEFTQEETGTLAIATTHTQARYALPDVIKKFRLRYPNVRLRIRQGNPKEITEMAVSGAADLAIATEEISASEELIALPCYQWNRCIVVPPDHPLLDLDRPVTLADIAAHPIVTYDFAFAGRTLTNRVFEAEGLRPNVVLTAIDSDVIKTYVQLGLGIGLLAAMAYDPKHDRGLRAIDVGHLFPPSTTWVGIRRGSYLRGYVYEFIELFAPHLDRGAIDAAMGAARGAGTQPA